MKLFWPIKGTFKQALETIERTHINEPFADEVIAFTQALSKRFLKMRHMPEVMALGYWLRKTNVMQMKAQFEEEHKDAFVRARGTVFHIAPSNVDTIFVYSWMLSLLAGNRNIIRISTKATLNDMLQIIVDELSKHEIGKQTIICTYEHHEGYTALLSSACHTRVIWGGDATIQVIRHEPLAPLANELAFADRFSLAVLNSEVVDDLSEEQFDQLLEHFYNDAFWFNQMACSSPRTVCWVGKKSERFWQGLVRKIEQKQYELVAATQVTKYTTALQLATVNGVENVLTKPQLTRITLTNLSSHIREQHCGGGLFYERELGHLCDVASFISDKDQTLAYYGFGKDELLEMLSKVTSRGLDRIVPVGQALDFDGVWDGQRFLTSFTREVVMK